MTREKALSQVAPFLSYFSDCKPAFAISECKAWINKIFDEHEKELKDKEEEIVRLHTELNGMEAYINEC